MEKVEKAKKLKLRERVLAYVVEKRRPKLIPSIILCVVLALTLMALSVYSAQKVKNEKVMNLAKTEASDDVAKISIAGEIVLGGNVKKRAEDIGYDKLFNQMQKLWKESDYIMASLDTCVLDKDESEYELTKLDKDKSLVTDKSTLEYIKKAGINAISLATDHIADFGRETIKTAIDEFNRLGVSYVGADEYREKAAQYKVLTVKTNDGTELKIAVIGAFGYKSKLHGAKDERKVEQEHTWADVLNELNSDATITPTPTPTPPEEEFNPWKETAGTLSGKYGELTNIINDAKSASDLVVVYLHWGDDRMFYETDEMRELAHRYILAGADVVVGSNPRVVLPIELYKKGIIFYSVGSLIGDSAETRMCDSVLVDITLDKNKNRLVEVTPLRIDSCIPKRTENILYVNRIFSELTKKLNDSDYKIEDNKLIIDIGQKRRAN